MPLDIRRESLSSPEAVELVSALDDEIRARHPAPLDGLYFRLDTGEVAPGRGSFAVARLGPSAVGCGAVRLVDADTAELKRMFVRPAFRGQGVATAILQFLEAEALALGVDRVVLETVADPPDAVALYRRAGYEEIPRFGPYVDSEISYCMGKRLASR